MEEIGIILPEKVFTLWLWFEFYFMFFNNKIIFIFNKFLKIFHKMNE